MCLGVLLSKDKTIAVWPHSARITSKCGLSDPISVTPTTQLGNVSTCTSDCSPVTRSLKRDLRTRWKHGQKGYESFFKIKETVKTLVVLHCIVIVSQRYCASFPCNSVYELKRKVFLKMREMIVGYVVTLKETLSEKYFRHFSYKL